MRLDAKEQTQVSLCSTSSTSLHRRVWRTEICTTIRERPVISKSNYGSGVINFSLVVTESVSCIRSSLIYISSPPDDRGLRGTFHEGD